MATKPLTSRFTNILAVVQLCVLLGGCVIDITASSYDGFVPENTVDQDFSPESRWSAQGEGEWIQYELSVSYPICGLEIAFHRGNARTAFFEIWLGDSPDTLTRVYKGQSSGNTLDLERFTFSVKSARYVRIVGLGNSENNWNSISEVAMLIEGDDKTNNNVRAHSLISPTRPVFSQNFESEAATTNWLGMANANVQTECGVNQSRCLQVDYVPTSRGSRWVGKDVPLPNAKEYTLQYDVKFDREFEFVRGGKMHGLGPTNKTSGCNPIEPDGWSARVMWRANGLAQLYTYHQDRQNTCGDGRFANYSFVKAQYQAVSLYVRVNSARNMNDGEVALYIDGNEVARWQNLRLRSEISEATEINHFLFTTFHGGNDASWSPSKTVSAYYDNFAVMPGRVIRRAPGDLQPDQTDNTVKPAFRIPGMFQEFLSDQ